MGLGAYPEIQLVGARRLREKWRGAIQHGKDPLAERELERAPKVAKMTFGAYAEEYMVAHASEWVPAQQQQWRNSLKQHAALLIPIPVDEIDTEAVLETLNPIWNKLIKVAPLLRYRIECIIDATKANTRQTREIRTHRR